MQEEGLGTPHSYAPEVVDETSVRSFLNLDTGDDGKSTEPPRDKK